MKPVLLSLAIAASSMMAGSAFAMESKGIFACSSDCNKAYWQCMRTDDGQNMSQRVVSCNSEVQACHSACRSS